MCPNRLGSSFNKYGKFLPGSNNIAKMREEEKGLVEEHNKVREQILLNMSESESVQQGGASSNGYLKPSLASVAG